MKLIIKMTAGLEMSKTHDGELGCGKKVRDEVIVDCIDNNFGGFEKC